MRLAHQDRMDQAVWVHRRRSVHTADLRASHAMATTPPPSSTAFLRIPGVELACASFTTRALTLTAQPDGHATLAAAEIVMQGVRATTAGARINIERVALEDVRGEIAPIAGAPAITSFVARHVVVEHLQAAVARGAVAAGDAPQSLQLDALRTLDGLVHAFVKDALWFVDADVAVPIRQGAVDFNAIVIENVGPNSLMGVSPAGIHVTGPAGQVRVPLVAFPSPPPGVSFGTDGGFPSARGDRGRIDLLPFLHALLESPPGQPLARLADGNLSGALARTRVKGEVQLGDGTLARGGQEPLHARLAIDRPAVGDRRPRNSRQPQLHWRCPDANYTSPHSTRWWRRTSSVTIRRRAARASCSRSNSQSCRMWRWCRQVRGRLFGRRREAGQPRLAISLAPITVSSR